MFTGLPCPQTHQPAQVRKVKQKEKQKVEVMEPSEDSKYSDSSRYSADLDESEDDDLMFLLSVEPLCKTFIVPYQWK